MKPQATQANSSKKLLKVPEAGHALGVTRSTIYRLIADGELDTVHVGARRVTRIEQSALDDYIRRNRVKRAS